MPAPLPQTPEERARQLSFLQNLMSEDPGILRKMVMGLTDLPHRASQGEFIEPGRDTLLYASQFAVPGAPESALGTGGGRPFYSKLGEAVEGMQPKATGPQLMATLRNQGVKPEELQYSGFEKQFGAAPSVTKGEAQTFLADNGVRVGEVIKGEEPLQWTVSSAGMPGGQGLTARFPTHAEAAAEFDRRQATGQGYHSITELPPEGSGTKFSQYQLPGGQNYKELLLTLPKKEAAPADIGDVSVEMYGKEFGSLTHVEKSNVLSEARSRDAEAKPSNFRSSHFDEPNVLAHIRMNDRVDANGKKTLFLEEIQSDWHQKGRKEGYKIAAPVDTSKWTAEPYKVDPHHANGWRVDDGEGGSLGLTTAGSREEAIANVARDRNIARSGGVPDAPFKKDWHELALKRAIKYAVDNGYDSVSWTPGKVQAERYDLSKHVDAISYDEASGRLRAYKKSGESYGEPVYGNPAISEDNVTPEKLANFIGKEAADKIINSPTRKSYGGAHMLEGQDLRVGGEGMNAFYDKMLPAAANKLGKKYGAKVGVTKINHYSGEMRNAMEGYGDHEVWSLPITDAMRAEVGKKGMPLFTGGLPLPQNQHQERARMLQNLPAIMGNRS